MMVHMAKTMILPAAMRHQCEVAGSMNATKAAGVDVGSQLEELKTLVTTISKFQAAIKALEHAADHTATCDTYSHAKYMKESVVSKMEELRTHGDALETMVADDLWPLPTYREMLFIK